MSESIRAMPIYIGNKMVAEAMSCDYEIDTNDEIQTGQTAVIGHTRGIRMTKLSFKAVVPVKGMSVDMIKNTLDGNDLDVGLPAGGKIYRQVMHIETAKITSESKSGKLEGDFTLSGGAPDVVS